MRNVGVLSSYVQLFQAAKNNKKFPTNYWQLKMIVPVSLHTQTYAEIERWSVLDSLLNISV